MKGSIRGGERVAAVAAVIIRYMLQYEHQS